MFRYVELIIRRRVSAWFAIVFLLLAGAATGLLPEAERTPVATDTMPVGYESTEVTTLLEQFPSGDGTVAFVLYTSSAGGSLESATQAELQRSFASVLAQTMAGADAAPADESGQADAGAAGPPAGVAGLQPAEDGTALLGVVPISATGGADVRDAVKQLRTELRADLPSGVQAQVTGPAGIQADLASVFDGANFRLLIATASVVAVLLIITYRSPVLWIVPLAVVGIADRLAALLASHALVWAGIPGDDSTMGIMSVLVFGAGTDYALLLISRYRDELRTHEDRYEAMRVALSSTAHAVLASSTTVFLGLLTLLVSLIPSTRGLGFACAVGIIVAATFAMIVLPTVLVLFGRWVFWPVAPKVGESRLTESSSLWGRIGNQVARHPMVFIVGTLTVLAMMAAGSAQIKTGLSPSEQFLDTPEAIVAADRLAESFPAGTSDPTVVMVRGDEARATETAKLAETVPGVASAQLVATHQDLAKVNVVLKDKAGSDAAQQTVTELRKALNGEGVYVGGTEAANLDADQASARDQLLIMPLILALVLVALVVLLRSVVAPLLLVATTLLTFFAGMGAAWWLFVGVFDFSRLDVGAPLFAFLFLVALGVDYNIFLVSRAAEETFGHGTRQGMLRALTATGGVITSAGILLAAVFAVLGVLPLVVLAQLGVIVCVGVLLDALVVRTVLVPALALALGDRFWWPRTFNSPTA